MNCGKCPIAQYISDKLERDDIEVASGSIWVGVRVYDYPLQQYPLLEGVWDFIHKFDDNEYPQLIIR